MLRSPMRVTLALLGVALFVGVWLVWSDATAPEPPAAAALPAPGADRPFVRSMQGTAPDGDLRALQSGPSALSAGGPLPYGELKRLFDYYLSAVGEQSIETITQHIQAELQRRLQPAQAQAAQRLLGLYIAFKRELVELERRPEINGQAVGAVRKRMLAMQDLRSRYFNAQETEGMFGFDDAYDQDAITRLEVSQDPKLSAVQKQQQLAALDAAMPANLRAERDATSVVVRVEQQALELRAKGASDDEIYRMRAQAFDASAAARLAEVDRDEAAWKARVAHYQNQRQQWLQANPQASQVERDAALSALQASLFTPAERPRLVAYE